MTNPRVVVPHIEELILLLPREKAGTIHAEDAKRLQQVRVDLTRYFERIETELARPARFGE
jgi:hypothetical protein